MKQTIHKYIFLISIIIIFPNIACGGSLSCWTPDCPSDAQRPGARIERTFLKNKKHKVRKKRNAYYKNNNTTVSIDSADIAGLFALGNKRISSITADGSVVEINVGDTSGNAQLWHMPDLTFVVSQIIESIEPNETPDIDFFTSSNLVYRAIETTNQDTNHIYYEITNEDILRLGEGHSNQGDPYLIDWFDTEAFLPIEKDWQILDTITTSWAFNPDIDSLVESKDLITVSDGILIPFNEDSVGAVLSCLIYEWAEYKNGIITDSGGYEAMIWFSEQGHWITGFLEPGAPLTGVTQFEYITYGKNIPSCPLTQDLGTVLLPDTYRAQNEIKSGATLTNGPIQFIAGQSIQLKNGFSSSSELNLLIDPVPCNL